MPYTDAVREAVCLCYENGTTSAIQIQREVLDAHGILVPERAIRRILEKRAKREAQKTPISAPAPEIAAEEDVSGETVLVIPDLHCPFQHPDALAFLKSVKAKVRPTKFVCLGDEIDAHAFSRYPKDPDGLGPGKEMTAAIEALLPFYLEFPEMLVCESNHTIRPWKVAFENGLPASFLPAVATYLNAPDGWVWKNHHMIDGVRYFHGDSGRSGQYAHIHYVKAFKKSCVIGHIHSHAGVNYEGELFGMNTGCLIDETAYCFKYAKNMATKPNLGCGVVFGGKKAVFFPMITDEHGRWVGNS
jgi:hypothetical protein